MALISVSFSWRRRSLVVSRTARVMFGREFISIILRNLSSIQPALRDVNRNSGRNPYPKISVKNYRSDKIGGRSGNEGLGLTLSEPGRRIGRNEMPWTLVIEPAGRKPNAR